VQSGALQLRNLLGAFEVAGKALSARSPPAADCAWPRVNPGAIPSGPVLLLDDVVDSGWTLTLLAVMLRQHGSGPVYPFALAKASPRGS
jgi:hypothetical protein